MTKYVLQLEVIAQPNSPNQLNGVMNALPNESDSGVWGDEYSVSRVDDPVDGNAYVTAHIPFDVQADAEGELNRLKGLQSFIDAVGGYLHVHECPTGGTDEQWDCGEHVTVEELLE